MIVLWFGKALVQQEEVGDIYDDAVMAKSLLRLVC